MEAIKCTDCGKGHLLPLSDMSKPTSSGFVVETRYKAWVCSNPECGLYIAMRGGDAYYAKLLPPKVS